MEDFLERQVGAGYVMPFLLYPLDPSFPSAFIPVGMVPTNLKYTTGDLDGYLSQIRHGLLAAGFGHVIPTTAADNPSVHRKLFLMGGNLRAYPTDREPGSGLGAELLEGDDAILTLAAFKRTGCTIETINVTDPSHNMKNGTLQVLHLAILMTLGNYVALTMMLVQVRVAAGLLAGDVNGSDPMDVGAAERRMNVATRRELAKHPESFGLLVYLWAIACGCASFFDRNPKTTPKMRVGWAFNCLVFLRWWLDWIEVTGRVATASFISMETNATYVIMCQMLVMLVLLWGSTFATLPFAPWLVGSDQSEHFNNEMRSFRLNQPDWTFADVLQLTKRFIHQLVMMTDPNVRLPPIRTKKGFNRSLYRPSPTRDHVQTEWLTVADVRAEYLAAVERVRPLIVALGMAEALRSAGRWHAPSLEEWDSIEKAIDAQEAAEAAEEAAAEERHVQPQRVGADEESEGEESGSEGEVEEAAAEGEDGGADEEHFPEKILNDRGRHPNRELLIKWKGWGSDPLDLTWQFEVGLIDDGNADFLEGWYKEQWAAGRTIMAPAGLSEAAATARADAGLESEEGEDSDASVRPPPPPQPPIHTIDMAVLLALLTASIGSEKPNGIHSKSLKPGSSTAQREAYERSHVTNPETGQVVHKRAALAFRQKQAKDAKPGAGHTQRYVTGERQPVIAEDSDGTGFACDEYYQLYLDENGRPLNSDADIMIDGSLRVGYARVLELRKLNGKRRVPRLSVRAADASCSMAVVLPLVKVSGRWVPDRTKAPPVLVPLLSLGRRAIATEGSGARSATFSFALAAVPAGGPELQQVHLSADLFEAAAMRVVDKDLMEMKVAELKDELEARGEAKTGNKAWLRRRLHAAIVRDYLEDV